MNFHDYLREYHRAGGALEGQRAEELLRRIGVRGPAGRAPCRECGADDCGKPACLRARVASEETAMFQERLGRHVAAAKRDARTRQHGGAAR